MIVPWQVVRMNELVAKPRKRLRVEVFHDPIDQAPDARNTRRIRMIGQPDIVRKDRVDVEGYHFGAHGVDVRRRPSNAGALYNCPEQCRAVVCAKRHEFLKRHTGEKTGQILLSFCLVGKLQRQAMLTQVINRSGCAIYREVGWSSRGHGMNAAKPNDLDVRIGRPR